MTRDEEAERREAFIGRVVGSMLGTFGLPVENDFWRFYRLVV